MLRGRDIFQSFFTRFPLLLECFMDSIVFENLDSWVTILRLLCGEYHLLENSVTQRNDLLSEETIEPSFTANHASPALLGVGEDLFLTRFLVTWLGTFVFSLRVGFVSYSALLAGTQLSQGQHHSLTPIILAKIYRSLRVASKATSLELPNQTFLWHYLYGWIHLHILGAFSCLKCPLYFLVRGYAIILQLSQVCATLESERIHLIFFASHLVTNRFSLVYLLDAVSLPPHLRGTVVTYRHDRQGRCMLIRSRQVLAVIEYLISMYPG
ncbi:hypothetical protein MA16_Dca027150 [Dendrobium catenatum]|uniref:Aminotransferase-like plant mobile domain-containing protein n=1 Tax=Dendrobium catenatum TaxID=906689 RepID=A0A2I0VID0_9ASPA|nr:hypothetical protein MA16_Dca027150 [Dendrobium catenatum]